MFKLRVMTLRWGLLAVNVALLMLFCQSGFSFFRGRSDDLDFEPPNAKAYSVEAGTKLEGGSRSAEKVIADLHRKEPPKAATAPTGPPVDLPATQGGPLDSWKIMSFGTWVDGTRAAFVTEGEDPAVLGGSLKPPPGAVSRGRGSRGSGRPPGGANPRAARAGQKATRTGLMIEGRAFRPGDDNFDIQIEKVDMGQRTVQYRDGASKKIFTLTQSPHEKIDPRKGLVGDMSLEAEEAASARGNAPDPGDMGKINAAADAAAKEKKEQEAAKAAAEKLAGESAGQDGTTPMTEEEKKAREQAAEQLEKANPTGEPATPPVETPKPEEGAANPGTGGEQQ